MIVNRKLIDRMGEVTSFFQRHQNLVNNQTDIIRFKSQKNKSKTILNLTLNNLNNSLRLKITYLRNIINKKRRINIFLNLEGILLRFFY